MIWLEEGFEEWQADKSEDAPFMTSKRCHMLLKLVHFLYKVVVVYVGGGWGSPLPNIIIPI